MRRNGCQEYGARFKKKAPQRPKKKGKKKLPSRRDQGAHRVRAQGWWESPILPVPPPSWGGRAYQRVSAKRTRWAQKSLSAPSMFLPLAVRCRCCCWCYCCCCCCRWVANQGSGITGSRRRGGWGGDLLRMWLPVKRGAGRPAGSAPLPPSGRQCSMGGSPDEGR